MLAMGTQGVWEWSESRWQLQGHSGQRLASSRFQLTGFAMVWDPKSGQIVRFGGRAPREVVNDFFGWDGSRWQPLSTDARLPPPRLRAAMAYDRARERLVLFGGDGGRLTELRDTWEWDGAAWVERTTENGPLPIQAGEEPTMVFDPDLEVVVFLRPDGTTWTWNGEVWAQAAAGPAWAKDVQADLKNSRVTAVASDGTLWYWQAGTWESSTQASGAFPERGDVRLAFDSSAEQFIALRTGFASSGSETWTLKDGVAREVSERVPSVRAHTAAAFDARRGRIVLFGGTSQAFDPVQLDDTWEWDGAEWLQKHPRVRPPVSSWHSMVYDSAGQRVLLHGASRAGESGDMWAWDGDDWSLIPNATSAAPGRGRLIWNDVGDHALLFGSGSNETWRWDDNGWQQLSPAVSPPVVAPRGRAMAHDSARNVTVLLNVDVASSGEIGGLGTWEWDGENWEQRSEQRVTWDEPMNLVYAADLGTTFLDTNWEWNGEQWTRFTLPGSPNEGLRHNTLVYDSQRDRVVGISRDMALWEYFQAGDACNQDSDCRTGYCVDQVCCDTACGGASGSDCLVCSRGAGGPMDGLCAARTNASECETATTTLEASPVAPGADAGMGSGVSGTRSSSSGCGCALAVPRRPVGIWLVFLPILLAFRRRRR